MKTAGWQKMFMRRASELLAESSSIHCQSSRARERREAVWGLVRRRSQSGLAQMLASDCGVEVAVGALFVVAEDDAGGSVGQWVVRGEDFGAGEMLGPGAEVAAEERCRPDLLVALEWLVGS